MSLIAIIIAKNMRERIFDVGEIRSLAIFEDEISDLFLWAARKEKYKRAVP